MGKKGNTGSGLTTGSLKLREKYIAAELGISQSNICRKEARILLKLRNMLEK
ncbi:MAG: hypothetical protein LBK56_11160 [Gracilibacteraceae bacterium]|jgi:DNA-directed RNA polymerase specialized sigma subunit|nr:hypothetical protein [Gracilibacteraceae bacterium]